ncbi:MAG TPA: aromatic ring-hydroxylating dioxygenase subunit alpha [Roseiflexaceae bacterium]|nr:aromatic ring-hydroxylating dioxygenase subunit alpha [Roseiflexaceae bacterium]HMP42660.1 aromatic ring-hydroxylating dioxygenase subunit alpha [Roseiflexaceae bacterium]
MEEIAPELHTLIHRQPAGYTLERAFYTDPAIFAIDIERVFLRHWLYVGHVSRIPQPGDYFLYTIGNESIVIVRGQDDDVHALFNVCRHRGSRICLEPSGQLKRLVCPYHAWVYAIDGALIQARHMPADFDTAQFGLRRCHVRVVEGLIFINASENPADFAAIAHDLTAFFAPYQLAHTKPAHHVRHVIQANWKLVAENFFECYHCGHTHPEFCTVMSYGRAVDSPRAAREQAAFVAEWEAQARHAGWRTGNIAITDETVHQIQRTPIRRGYQTQSEDGMPVAPLLGCLSAYDGAVTATQLYPLIWLLACSDHAMLARFTPLSPTETELELSWMVRADAIEGIDYDPERVSWLWRLTAEEDKTICENNQRGVASYSYRPGPYSTHESSVEHLVRWYLRQLVDDWEFVER